MMLFRHLFLSNINILIILFKHFIDDISSFLCIFFDTYIIDNYDFQIRMTVTTNKTKQVLKVKGRSTASKIVVMNSDLHVGSDYAITSIDGPDKPTKWQIVQREHWLESIDLVGKHELQVINGEPMNGINKKNNGAENYTSNVSTQRRHAVDAVKEWKFDHIIVTRGSGYHSSDGGWTWYEEDFAQQIGAIKNGDNGDYTDEETAFRIGDKVFNCSHHVAGSIWFAYSTTSMTREGMGLSLNRTKYYDDNVRHIDVVIRSHRHHRHMTDIGRTLLLQTGCWQFRNRYMKRSGMGALYPTIGTSWFIVEPNGEISYHKNDLPDYKIPKKELVRFAF